MQEATRQKEKEQPKRCPATHKIAAGYERACVKDIAHVAGGYDHMDAWGERWPVTEEERAAQAKVPRG